MVMVDGPLAGCDASAISRPAWTTTVSAVAGAPASRQEIARPASERSSYIPFPHEGGSMRQARPRFNPNSPPACVRIATPRGLFGRRPVVAMAVCDDPPSAFPQREEKSAPPARCRRGAHPHPSTPRGSGGEEGKPGTYQKKS
jgi:hypothetical protein